MTILTKKEAAAILGKIKNHADFELMKATLRIERKEFPQDILMIKLLLQM